MQELTSSSFVRCTWSSVIVAEIRSVPSGCAMIPTGSFFPIRMAVVHSLGSVTTRDDPPVI